MTEQPFFIRPVDTLYFGRPASFSAGEAHHGASMFPPPPMAFQGMIRTRLLRGVAGLNLDDWSQEACARRAELVGDADALPPSWQIEGPYPARETRDRYRDPAYQLWLPVPRWLLEAGPRKQPMRAAVVECEQDAMDDLPDEDTLEPVGAPTTPASKPLTGWLSSQNLRWALAGDVEWDLESFSRRYPSFVEAERRSGVAINPQTHAALHDLLYFLETIRMQPGSGLVAWLRGEFPSDVSPSSLTSGYGRAGRSGRLAAFEPLEGTDEHWDYLRRGRHLPDEIERFRERFWIVLLSPVWLENPLRPKLNAPVGDVQVQFLSALFGPALTLGGYSMVSGEMRANKPYIPAGSCWLVEVSGGSARARADTLRGLNGSFLPNGGQERFGFGHILVGHYFGSGSALHEFKWT